METRDERSYYDAIQERIREARARRDSELSVLPLTIVIAIAVLVALVLNAGTALGAELAWASLSPPKGEDLLLRAAAKGVQVYECRRDEGGLRWVLVGPDATLADDAGRKIGKHYEGPTWESNDGSLVVGRVVASSSKDDPAAIPHLLLRAKEHRGTGVFAKVTSIQRLHTNGGRAPADGCGEADIGRRARVQYTATYYFYEDARLARP